MFKVERFILSLFEFPSSDDQMCDFHAERLDAFVKRRGLS